MRKIRSGLRINGNWNCLNGLQPRFPVNKAELFRQLRQINRPTHFSILLSWDQSQDPALIKSSIFSLSSQIYSSWDLNLVCEASQASMNWLKGQHLPISVCTDENECLGAVEGEYVIPLGAGDRLARVALAELAIFLDNRQDLDLVYSDEDRVERRGRRSHIVCKPDWSPDYLLSHNYIGRLVAYRRDKLLLAGGFSPENDISDDYNLTLRFTRLTQAVGHIPHVLYSRLIDTLPADPNKVRIALEDELQFRNWHPRIEPVPEHPGVYATHWDTVYSPLISIIICTQDRTDLLSACLGSIFDKSTYANFEVVLMDNGSQQHETQALIQIWKEREPSRFRVICLDVPFNFSLLNNRAVGLTSGELLLFLNNDTEVVSQHWLEEMAGQALREKTGVVSALLTFPDHRIQHAGILVGGKDLAVHAYRGVLTNFAKMPNRLVVPSNFPALTGACLMVRKELFMSMGGFNEDLAISYGDVDLCLRLKRAGYNNILLPFVHLIHRESATRGYEITREKRNRLQTEARILRELWPEIKESNLILTA